ncbi:uncharacterized protein Z518_05711 [Rhinocladiella mackenziei CBS 650.93]|uniref:Choline transport protein n=1 Tax=Rhinocladiella mackenziei CBS 650.93 TaxID=1442369 RepID=A0A0D2J6Y5_9EURO|nr:uncharacterized protein Z518_05711 [Rhinocladiella mackenziei CBS 650.93]KIX04840.1 hypothetical protein Z518_05711 [Rhinocladiella mackenziei CBS 650.93]
MDTSTAPVSQEGEGHLEHRFSRLTMIGLTFGILNTWICLAGSLGIVMPSGSSVSFLYGFVFCVICNLCLSASVGELSSIRPTAGGQYHYAAFFAAQFISAAAVVGSDGAYEITPWKTYLIFLGVSTFTVLLNIFGYRILNRWNEFALFWSVLGCIVVSITILATGKKTSAKHVFTNFTNSTGWSDGMAWILGLLQSALSLIGFDAPQRDAPQAMVAAVGIGGTTGNLFILVMLFSLVDVDAILSTNTNVSVTEMIYQATRSRAAAVVLSCALAICFVNGTNGCVTSGSRLLWAMARDNGSPFSKFLSHITPGLNVPMRAILAAAVFNMLFGLLYLGPTVAFNAYCASCTIFLNMSYAIPVTILLLCGRKLVNKNRPVFFLGHIVGYVVNWTSVLFFFCFPRFLPVDASTMNYVAAVVGIFLIFATGLWLAKRGQYNGPQFEIILGEDVLAATPAIEAAKGGMEHREQV